MILHAWVGRGGLGSDLSPYCLFASSTHTFPVFAPKKCTKSSRRWFSVIYTANSFVVLDSPSSTTVLVKSEKTDRRSTNTRDLGNTFPQVTKDDKRTRPVGLFPNKQEGSLITKPSAGPAPASKHLSGWVNSAHQKQMPLIR